MPDSRRKCAIFAASAIALLSPAPLMSRVLFFFGLGLSAQTVKRSLNGLLRLRPDRHTLTSLCALLLTVFALVPISLGEMKNEEAALLFLLSFTAENPATAYDSVIFSLTLIGAFLAFLAVTALSGSPSDGIRAAVNTLLCGAALSLTQKTTRTEIRSYPFGS